MPLSLTNLDKWLQSYIDKPLKHITYASSKLLIILLQVKDIYFKSWMPANFYLDFRPFVIGNMAVSWKNIFFNYILIFLKEKYIFPLWKIKNIKKGIVKNIGLN